MSKIQDFKSEFYAKRNPEEIEDVSSIGKDNFAYTGQSRDSRTTENDGSAAIYSTGRKYDAVVEKKPAHQVTKDPCRGALLEKKIGLLGALSLIVGCMIGSGIFATGSTVSMRAGSSGMILCVWSGCGVLATLGALCYAELGTAIPKSGSEHTYLTYAFGDLGGFMYTWVSTIVIKPSGQAGICTAFGAYLVEALGGSSYCTIEKSLLVKLLAAFAIGKVSCSEYEIVRARLTLLA